MIMVVPFKNEPGIDFSVQENVDRFNEILKKVKGNLVKIFRYSSMVKK